MTDKNFPEVVNQIHEKDGRYGKGAYYFVREALDHTLKVLCQEGSQEANHVTGPQLLDGIREYALDRYGPMTKTVMDHWNVTKCRDFGDIVFQLVDCSVLGKTDNDSPEDFADGYDFHDAFESPFLPSDEKGKGGSPSLN